MDKVSYHDFCEAFGKANEDGTVLYGVVVFSKSNWKTDYSLESRSYATYSDQWGWDYSKMGHCRIGYALDGSDSCRMDYYDWKVDYCYFITKEEFDAIADRYHL